MIRKAQSLDDWNEIRQICCETGNAGDPIDPGRWPFFSEHWIGPYQKLVPEWCWVLTDENHPKTLLGYLTGCPNSRTFASRRIAHFDVPLFIKIATGRYSWNPDVRRYLKRRLGWERDPNSLFPRELLNRLEAEYPAHLHINLRPKARQGGWGARLIQAYWDELNSTSEAVGVHVFCGKNPVKFYRRVGFELLGEIEYRPGIPVYCMGKQ